MSGRHSMQLSKLVYLALLVALSLGLFLFEGLLPVPFLAPGAKLGLANIVTVLAIYALPRLREALLVLLLRVGLAAMLGGGPALFMYSLSGGLLSFAGMAVLRRSGAFSILAVSAAGGFLHNVGQLMIACVAVGNVGLFAYLPILGPCGLLTGLVIGAVAAGILPRLPKVSDVY